MPAPLELQDVDWIIITKDNADEVFEKIKNEKNGGLRFIRFDR